MTVTMTMLMSVDYVPGRTLNFSHLTIISYSQLSNHGPHFADEETEAGREVK